MKSQLVLISVLVPIATALPVDQNDITKRWYGDSSVGSSPVSSHGRGGRGSIIVHRGSRGGGFNRGFISGRGKFSRFGRGFGGHGRGGSRQRRAGFHGRGGRRKIIAIHSGRGANRGRSGGFNRGVHDSSGGRSVGHGDISASHGSHGGTVSGVIHHSGNTGDVHDWR